MKTTESSLSCLHVPADADRLDPREMTANIITFDELSRVSVPLNHAAWFRLPTNRAELPIDILVLNRGSNDLVGSFHGALNRQLYEIPRFERLNSLLKFGSSLVVVSDPSLHMSDALQLSWFTGWSDYDAHAAIAQAITSIQERLGTQRLVLSGSSGGGFAALQISALIPESIAVAFNPQTDIHSYLNAGTSLAAQRAYAQIVWPDVMGKTVTDSQLYVDWTADLPVRLSALRTYGSPTSNRIVLVQNIDEFHYEHHYLPMLAACARGGNLGRVKTFEYAGGELHTPPTPQIFHDAMTRVLADDYSENWLGTGAAPVMPKRLDPAFMLSRASAQDTATSSEGALADLGSNQAITVDPSAADQLAQIETRLKALESAAGNVGKYCAISDSASIDPSVSFSAEYTGAQISIGAHTKVFRGAEWLGPVEVGNRVFINRDSYIRPHVVIEDDVSLGPFVRLISDTHEHGTRVRRTGTPIKLPIRIGRGSWLGAGVTVVGGVTIGEGCMIAAGAVVTKDIPANSLAGGIPARVIRSLDELAD